MRVIEKIYIQALLLSCVLMSFVWGARTLYFIMFCAFIWGVLHIVSMQKVMKWQIQWAVIITGANLLSAISGDVIGQIPYNWSWIVQILLLPLILIGIDYLLKKNTEYFNRQLKNMFVLSLFILVIQQIVGIVEMGISHILSFKSLFFTDSYTYANVASVKLGLMKSIISFVATLLFISIRDRYTTKKQVLLLLFIFLSTLTVGAKANLIGILFLGLIVFISRLAKKSHKVIVVVCILFGVTLIFSSYFYEMYIYSIYDGRYLMPVFMSTDFWRMPFGVGAGNYVDAASSNLISVETFGMIPVAIPETMNNPYSLYPVAESDILLLSVSFGWVFYFIYVFYVLRIIYRYVFNNAWHGICFGRGAELMIYLFFVGFFQDFFNVHTYWVFLAISLSLINAPKHLIKCYERGILSLKHNR